MTDDTGAAGFYAFGDFSWTGVAGSQRLAVSYNDVYNDGGTPYGPQIGTVPPSGTGAKTVDPKYASVNVGSPYFLYLDSTQTTIGSSASDGSAIGARPTVVASKPGRVTGVIATGQSTNSISVFWTDLTNESSYTLFMNTTVNTLTAVNLGGTGQNITTISVSGLNSDTGYFFWVVL